MLSRETLSREHAELDALALQLLDHVKSRTCDTEGLSALRWRLNHVLMVHLAKEDKLLYPRLKASGEPRTRGLADRFAEEMGGLGATYGAYTAEWTMERVAADWPGFAVATRTGMRALRQRIQREERDLYPCLDAARRSREDGAPLA